MKKNLQVEFSEKQEYSQEVIDLLYDIVQRTKDASEQRNASEYFISIVRDQEYIDSIKNMLKRLRGSQLELIVVIGIGGSSLGAQAVYDALVTTQSDLISMLFLESLDPDYLFLNYQKILSILQQQKEILICIISKSGSTLETLIHTEIFLEKFKKYTSHITMCAITDPGSALEQVAQKYSWNYISIPPHIGGRFSVFSAVGLVPLGLSGVSIDELCSGVKDATILCFQSENIYNNNAAMIAGMIYEYYKKDYRIHDFFYFSTVCMSLGAWCRQLFAESLGKIKKIDQKEERVGILPTVSLGTQDLHSMFQLYMAGPQNFVTSFITISSWQHDYKLGTENLFLSQLDYIKEKSVSSVLSAIIQGVKQAYQQQEHPYYSIEIPELSAYTLGQYMQMYMIVTVYLGRLFSINPFDQEQVELYKHKTHEILKT